MTNYSRFIRIISIQHLSYSQDPITPVLVVVTNISSKDALNVTIALNNALFQTEGKYITYSENYTARFFK